MDNEITESAKAVQEVAKTTGKGIEAVDKIGSFFSRVMGESIDATCGMLSDTLKYKRWERQIKLVEKAENLIESKGIRDRMRPIKPKLALPIFQAASLEDEDELHDIWARLFVTALDPDCKAPRTAFIDIIRQLEPVDVMVLSVIYENWVERKKELKYNVLSTTSKYLSGVNDKIQKEYRRFGKQYEKFSPTIYPCSQDTIIEGLNIDDVWYRNSIDNLIRQRLVASYTVHDYFEAKIDGGYDGVDLTIDKGYDEVCITDLGVSFVQACLP